MGAIIVSPYKITNVHGGYYGLVITTRPRPQTRHRWIYPTHKHTYTAGRDYYWDHYARRRYEVNFHSHVDIIDAPVTTSTRQHTNIAVTCEPSYFW